MTIALVELTYTDSSHPLHVKFPPETGRVHQHSDHARLKEMKQRTFVARARSDFRRSSASVVLRLESIVCPRCMSQHLLEEYVSWHGCPSSALVWQLVYSDVLSRLHQHFDAPHD